MDVQCDRCHSEYDFDEDRIPSEGLPVKCSTCGHVFKVYAPSDLPSTGSSGEWMIRQVAGNVFTFRELTTLQRWIVERKVARDDQISKTGRHWKRLGDIAELATFFQVVEAQPQHVAPPGGFPQPPHGSGPQQQMPMPGVPQQISTNPQMPMPGVPQQRPTNPQMPMPGMQMPHGTGPQPQMQMPPGTGPQMPYPPHTQAAWEGSPQPPPTWNQQSDSWQAMSSGEVPYEEEEEEDIVIGGGGKGKWVALVLLLVVGGGGAALYTQRPDLVQPYLDKIIGGGVNEVALKHVTDGYAALGRDSYAAIDEAIAEFNKAIAIDPKYPAAKAAVAEAELTRAEYAREEADILSKKLPGLGEEEQKQAQLDIDNKRREASERSGRAFKAGKDALTLNGESLEANRAMANYYRYKQATEQMQTLLDKARQLAPNDARTSLIQGASAMSDPSTTERAIRYLDEALERDPQLQRARYALAWVYATQGAKEKAQEHLDALLEQVPDHDRAKALAAELAPPVVAEPEPEPEPEPESEAEPEKKVNYRQLMAQADRLRETDRAGKALQLYEKASEAAPEDPDVYTGMGWCYLDLEQPAAAIATFKLALRQAPRLSDAHMGLAEAYRMKGDKANAIQHYKKYLDIMPSGPDAAVARRMLEQLK